MVFGCLATIVTKSNLKSILTNHINSIKMLLIHMILYHSTPNARKQDSHHQSRHFSIMAKKGIQISCHRVEDAHFVNKNSTQNQKKNVLKTISSRYWSFWLTTFYWWCLQELFFSNILALLWVPLAPQFLYSYIFFKLQRSVVHPCSPQKKNIAHQLSFIHYVVSINNPNFKCSRQEEAKKEEILLSLYDKSPYTDRKVQKATWQHTKKSPPKLLQRLRTDLGSQLE